MNLNHFEKFLLKFASSFVLILCIAFSFYIHIFGKSTPGGGFQAGALLASGIIIYEVANSITIISKRTLNILTFCGLTAYITTGIFSIFFSGTLFEYQIFHPNFGHIIGSFAIETSILLVVTSAIIRISHSIQTIQG